MKTKLLAPGEEVLVRFELSAREDMSFIGRNNERIVEAGDFVLSIANLSASFTLL